MARERLMLRFARALERRSPRLAHYVAVPHVAGVSRSGEVGGHTEFWNPIAAPESSGPTVLVVVETPIAGRWLGASLSSRLGVRVVVTRAVDAPVPDDLDVNAIVGVGDACTSAILLCRHSRAGRLALVSPVGLPTSVPSGLPTTLIQSSAVGVYRPEVAAFERTLRATGTAVRDTDYPETSDEWVRLPRLVKGSAAALDDLVAFLERGIGSKATFDVIPGWDLH